MLALQIARELGGEIKVGLMEIQIQYGGVRMPVVALPRTVKEKSPVMVQE